MDPRQRYASRPDSPPRRGGGPPLNVPGGRPRSPPHYPQRAGDAGPDYRGGDDYYRGPPQGQKDFLYDDERYGRSRQSGPPPPQYYPHDPDWASQGRGNSVPPPRNAPPRAHSPPPDPRVRLNSSRDFPPPSNAGPPRSSAPPASSSGPPGNVRYTVLKRNRSVSPSVEAAYRFRFQLPAPDLVPILIGQRGTAAKNIKQFSGLARLTFMNEPEGPIAELAGSRASIRDGLHGIVLTLQEAANFPDVVPPALRLACANAADWANYDERFVEDLNISKRDFIAQVAAIPPPTLADELAARGGAGKADHREPRSRHDGPTDRPPSYSVTLPKEVEGHILGKKGAVIQSIERDTRTRLFLERRGNAPTLEIWGTPDQCDHVMRIVDGIVAKHAPTRLRNGGPPSGDRPPPPPPPARSTSGHRPSNDDDDAFNHSRRPSIISPPPRTDSYKLQPQESKSSSALPPSIAQMSALEIARFIVTLSHSERELIQSALRNAASSTSTSSSYASSSLNGPPTASSANSSLVLDSPSVAGTSDHPPPPNGLASSSTSSPLDHQQHQHQQQRALGESTSTLKRKQSLADLDSPDARLGLAPGDQQQSELEQSQGAASGSGGLTSAFKNLTSFFRG